LPQITYLESVNRALADAMRADARVFLLGEDIGHFGGAFGVTKGLSDEFGDDRVIDTPIAEEGFVGAAIGAAWMGERPVVELQFADFASCAFDPIVTVAAKTHWRSGIRLPLVIRFGVAAACVGIGEPAKEIAARETGVPHLGTEQRDGEPVLHDGLGQVGEDHRGSVLEPVEHPEQGWADMVRGAQPRRCGVAGQPEQVIALVEGEPQGPRDRAEHLLRRLRAALLLQPRVVIRRHAGQRGDLLAAQAQSATAYPGAEPEVARLQALTALAQEVR